MNEIVNLGNGQFVKVCMLKGQQGDNIQSIVKTSTQGLVDTYTITLTDGSTKTFTVSNGKGIVSIEKTGTSGLVDTYTITFNDNTTQTFNVTNGNGIVSIEKTSTVGLVDTYTITLNSGNPVTFTVTNGKGISSIEKTGTSGLVDTYTITYNDNTTSTFDVTNGANGQDVSQSNLAPVESTSIASQSYSIGDLLVFNGQLYKVTQAIAQGETLQINVNISVDSVASEINETKEKLLVSLTGGNGSWVNTLKVLVTNDAYREYFSKRKITKLVLRNNDSYNHNYKIFYPMFGTDELKDASSSFFIFGSTSGTAQGGYVTTLRLEYNAVSLATFGIFYSGSTEDFSRDVTNTNNSMPSYNVLDVYYKD